MIDPSEPLALTTIGAASTLLLIRGALLLRYRPASDDQSHGAISDDGLPGAQHARVARLHGGLLVAVGTAGWSLLFDACEALPFLAP